jgi:cytochrome P450
VAGHRLPHGPGIARDWRTFSNAKGHHSPGADHEFGLALKPVETDPPEHGEWRRVLNPYFTRARALRFVEPARRIADELIDRFIEQGECEIVRDYARPLPPAVLTEYLGLPAELLPAAKVGTEPIPGDAVEQMVANFVEFRRARPRGGDLVDAILEARPFGKPVSDADAVSVITLLVRAAQTTTVGTLTNSLVHLATQPSDRDRLVENPQLLDSATEEFLRLYSSLARARFVTRDARVGDKLLRQGEFVNLSWAGANRDDEFFSCPNAWDPERSPNRHMTFGTARHFCLGASVARVVLKVGIGQAMTRMPGLMRAGGERATPGGSTATSGGGAMYPARLKF